MKKIILSVFTLATMAMVACGPSAEEKAAAEKARQDSIANAEAEIARQAAEEAALKAMQDSIAAANQKALQDSIAMLKGTVKKIQQNAQDTKKKEEKKQEEYKQQQKGKG